MCAYACVCACVHACVTTQDFTWQGVVVYFPLNITFLPQTSAFFNMLPIQPYCVESSVKFALSHVLLKLISLPDTFICDFLRMKLSLKYTILSNSFIIEYYGYNIWIGKTTILYIKSKNILDIKFHWYNMNAWGRREINYYAK